MSLPQIPLSLEERFFHTQEELKRHRRRRRWLWSFLILSVLVNVTFSVVLKIRSRPHERGQKTVFVEHLISGGTDSEDKVAVIRLDGIITSQGEGHMNHDGMVGDIKEQLRVATEDEAVKAVILKIDSPGGEVLASDEIYRAVRAVRDGKTKKPVICSMGSLAASGGYYAAMGADWIIADNLTLTGSIGVIMQTLNYKDLFGKVGLRSFVFKSGKFKDILNGSRDPSPEEMDLVQNLVMETYDQFLEIVAKERKLDPQALREGLADGRILSGKQAIAAKLVDQVGSFQDAIDKAKRLAGIQNARVIDYEVPFDLGSLLGLFVKSSVPKLQIDLMPQSLHLEQGKLYYLSSHLF